MNDARGVDNQAHGGATLHEVTSPQPKIELEPALAPEDRLRAMFDECFDFVWRSLRRLGVPAATVDDATQEVFLVASRRLDDIALGSERSFLFATAIRVASTARRGQARRGEHDERAVAGLVDVSPSPAEVVDRQRARAVLDRILDDLDDDLRAVFVLYELEEMTMAEIATTLELAPGTVASRLRRAREQFQACATRLRRNA
ncbi:MAG: sigma-70 family RNA polymerase sigma factor [Kofleriaceae bacterium]|nr:sigma-70 family RNA polymerase sigma factor [Kofleriaceae bacterium]